MLETATLYEGISAESTCSLKEYVVYRVDEREGWSREVAGDSSLELEATRFADLLLETEPRYLDGISYEVRISRTGELLHVSTRENSLNECTTAPRG